MIGLFLTWASGNSARVRTANRLPDGACDDEVALGTILATRSEGRAAARRVHLAIVHQPHQRLENRLQ